MTAATVEMARRPAGRGRGESETAYNPRLFASCVRGSAPRSAVPVSLHSVAPMPIYAYRCDACGFRKDVLQKMSDPALTVCLSCGAESFAKQLSAPAFQLKGTGWYATDFRDKAKKPEGAEADAAAPAGEAVAAGGTEGGPDKGAAGKGADSKVADGKAADSRGNGKVADGNAGDGKGANGTNGTGAEGKGRGAQGDGAAASGGAVAPAAKPAGKGSGSTGTTSGGSGAS